MTQSLMKLLEVPDETPKDFYKNPQYLERTKQISELAKSLVHEISDEGRIQAKSDCVAIRKYVKTTDSFTLNVFRSLTDKVKAWRDDFTGETKSLSQIADDIMAKFESLEHEKLKLVEDRIAIQLMALRADAEIKEEFITRPDLSPIIKLSSVTDAGNLTSKALKLLTDITTAEKAEQVRYDARLVQIKLKSLEADINPPLDPEYLGQSIFADDAIFNDRLDQVIKIEIERREETKRRIIKQQEQENQRKIEAAIKEAEIAVTERLKIQEAERLKLVERQRLEASKIMALAQESAKKPTPDQLRQEAHDITEMAERAETNAERNKELNQASALKKQAADLENKSRICTVTMTFKMPVKYTCSLAKLEALFISEVTLSDKAQKAFIGVKANDA